MFEKVKFPVALNPSRKISVLAEKKGWMVANYSNVIDKVNRLLFAG